MRAVPRCLLLAAAVPLGRGGASMTLHGGQGLREGSCPVLSRLTKDSDCLRP